VENVFFDVLEIGTHVDVKQVPVLHESVHPAFGFDEVEH